MRLAPEPPVPPPIVTPPVPEITPEKLEVNPVPAGLASVKMLLPRMTEPDPERNWIEGPAVAADMSNVPLSVKVLFAAAKDPAPATANVAPELMVRLLRTLVPLRVWVPPAMVRLAGTVFPMEPENVPEAFVIVRPPPSTTPEPLNDLMEAPMPLRSNVPFTTTPLDAAMFCGVNPM